MSHPLTNQESGQANTAIQEFLKKAKRAGQIVGKKPEQDRRANALRATARTRKGRHG